MDRAIFELKASVDATSLYILICALMDQGLEVVTLSRAIRQWNGTKETLLEATEELVRRGVLQGGQSLDDEMPLQINPRSEWR